MPVNFSELQVIFDRIEAGKQLGQQELQVLLKAIESKQITIDTGKRAVAIGGNVTDALIVTGDRNIILDREILQQILDLLREAQAENLHSSVSIDWQQTSKSLLTEQIELLTSNPLTHEEGIVYHTDRVCVPLGLVESKRKSFRLGEVDPEYGSSVYEETEIAQKFEHEEFREQVLRCGQSPHSKGRRIAIIGEPGAGKTTLLQQLARWVSENIDGSIVMWVSLADLRGRLLDDYLLGCRLQALVQQQGQAEASSQVKNEFVAQFQQDRVWLLLDGVDEMQASSGNPLSEIDRQIQESGLLKQARIVLTCRLNLWDGNRQALSTFDTYRTLVFSYPQQVELFIGQWFEILPDARQGQAERLCAELKQAGKERIRDLVRNPLRLTLLCFNWCSAEGKLPETKAGLYERFVSDFYEWKKERFPTRIERRKQLNAALGDLAREAIDNEEIRFRLREEFISKYLGEPDDEDSLFCLALKLGWLNRVGVESENRRKSVYAFFHPTFQEYFAASSIDDSSFFLNHYPDRPSHPEASYRVFDPQWKEVFLLWIGQTRESLAEHKNSLVQSLVEFKDGCGDYYSDRAKFLTASGIAEFKLCKLSSEIVSEVSKLCFGYVDRSKQKWCKFADPIPWMAEAALLETDSDLVIDIITEQLVPDSTNSLYPDRDVAMKCAEILGLLGKDNPKAVKSLVQLIQFPDFTNRNPPDQFFMFVRDEAAKSLVKIASGDKQAIRDLKRIYSSKMNEEMQTQIVVTIGKLSPNDSFAKNFFAEKIDSASEDREKLSAAWSILSFDDQNDIAINILSVLTDSYDSNVADTATKLLEQGATITYGKDTAEYSQYEIDEVKKAFANAESIFDLLGDNVPNLALSYAAHEIREVAKIDYPRVVRDLLEQLHIKTDTLGLQSIVSILGDISAGDENVTLALVDFLKNHKSLLGFTIRTFYKILDGLNQHSLCILVVKNLKDYLQDSQTRENIMRRIQIYEIIWICARKLKYQDFYFAWHSK